MIHLLEKSAHLSLPSQPITPPAGVALGRLEWGVLEGDPASCSELTFPQLFSSDLGLLHIHTRRELGASGE